MSGTAGEIWTAFATVEGESEAQTLADAMERIDPAPTGVGCFEVEDDSGLWEVGGYFTGRPDPIALLVLEATFGSSTFAVSLIPPEDWVSKVRRELRPVRAGRFLLHGGHDEGDAPPSAIRLRIEAAMAFGTGHHGTTRGVLMSMHDLAMHGIAPARVLDLGTGTGALAMGAAKLWRAQCVATDIDPVAVATAKENARFNGTLTSTRIVEAARASIPEVTRGAPYDLIVANILANPLRRLAPQITRVSRPGGHIILSGILHRQARSVENVFAGWRMNTIGRRKLGEWTTLTLQRY